MSTVAPRGKKDRYTARQRRWRTVAEALNALDHWERRFNVEPPLEVMDAGGFPLLRLQGNGALFEHPWRVTLDDAGEHATVAGGHVHDGSDWVEVAGLAEADLSDGQVWWLRVKYYNDPGAAAEFEVLSGTEFPESSYYPDVIPDPGHPDSLPQAGWCEAILPIAEYSEAEGLEQHLFEDVWLPRGLTQIEDRVIGQRCVDYKLELLVVTEVHVRGIMTESGVPKWVSGDCDTVDPSESSSSSASSSDGTWANAGWYCVKHWIGATCPVTIKTSSMCLYIGDQATWDNYQFGVCRNAPPPLTPPKEMWTTDGVKHETQAACIAAGCS